MKYFYHRGHRVTQSKRQKIEKLCSYQFPDILSLCSLWFKIIGLFPLREELSGDDLYLAALGMDLQWFATPEEEGRVHEPTDVTYRKAREEGRVAKSQDIIAALGLLLPAIAIYFLAPWMLRTCAEMLRFFFTRINELDPLTDRVTAGLFMNYFLRLALPILSIAMVAALFSNWVQTGFLFSTKPLGPDFSRILPRFGRYFERIFSVEGLVNLLKSVFKMGIIGTVAYIIVRSKFNELANLQKAGLWQGITLIASLAGKLLIIVALLLLGLSIPDFMFQRWQFRQSLKMTREAAKEELKQDEGDPEVRGRLKRLYRELLSRNMLSAVPNADVVITNPTHYSVALLYVMDQMEGPRVVAKGEDDLAFRIREIAKENDVPVYSNPPLTRAIYDRTEVGDQIPEWCFNAVALILAKFYTFEQMREKAQKLGKNHWTARMGA